MTNGPKNNQNSWSKNSLVFQVQALTISRPVQNVAQLAKDLEN